MNLEPIDTSTTAGKARVMQLAAEGRKCFIQRKGDDFVHDTVDSDTHDWDWKAFDYFLGVGFDGPEVMWVFLNGDRHVCGYSEIGPEAARNGEATVRYIRADLAGEAS